MVVGEWWDINLPSCWRMGLMMLLGSAVLVSNSQVKEVVLPHDMRVADSGT